MREYEDYTLDMNSEQLVEEVELYLRADSLCRYCKAPLGLDAQVDTRSH